MSSPVEEGVTYAPISFRPPSRPPKINTVSSEKKTRSHPPVLPKRPDKRLPLKENASTQTFHIEDWVWNERKLVIFGVFVLVFFLTSISASSYMFIARKIGCDNLDTYKVVSHLSKYPVEKEKPDVTVNHIPLYQRLKSKLQFLDRTVCRNFLNQPYVELCNRIGRIWSFNEVLWCLCSSDSVIMKFNFNGMWLENIRIRWMGLSILCLHVHPEDSSLIISTANGLYIQRRNKEAEELKHPSINDITQDKGVVYILTCDAVYRLTNSIYGNYKLDIPSKIPSYNCGFRRRGRDRLAIKGNVMFVSVYHQKIIIRTGLYNTALFKIFKMEQKSFICALLDMNYLVLFNDIHNNVSLYRMSPHDSLVLQYEHKYRVTVRDVVIKENVMWILFDNVIHKHDLLFTPPTI